MNAERKWLDAETAAEMLYPPGWRNPPLQFDTPERDRYEEAIREWKESRYDYEQEREE